MYTIWVLKYKVSGLRHIGLRAEGVGFRFKVSGLCWMLRLLFRFPLRLPIRLKVLGFGVEPRDVLGCV